MLSQCALARGSADCRQFAIAELEREQTQTRAYDVEYGQLQIEQSTWAMPARVERIAREHLRMELPAAGRVEVIDGTPR